MSGKMTKSILRPPIPTTPGTSSRPQLASMLQEGRKSANIHLSSGSHLGIPDYSVFCSSASAKDLNGDPYHTIGRRLNAILVACRCCCIYFRLRGCSR